MDAAVGGAAYGFVNAFSMEIKAFPVASIVAGFASAFAESLTNEIISYVQGIKEGSSENIISSIRNVIYDTGKNGIQYAVTGTIATQVFLTSLGPFDTVDFLTQGPEMGKAWSQSIFQSPMVKISNIGNTISSHFLGPKKVLNKISRKTTKEKTVKAYSFDCMNGVDRMKEIIKSLKKWVLLYEIRAFSPLLIAVNFTFLYFSFRDGAVLDTNIGITIDFGYLFLLPFLILTVLFIYSNIYLIKGSSKKIVRKPYKIELGLHSKDEICSILSKKLEFKTVAEDCMYAFVSTIGTDYRTFVFLFDEKNQIDGIEIADQYVKKVNEMTGFKPVARIHTNKYTQRQQIFIYESVPQAVLDKVQESVYSDNIHNDILTNFILDLSEGVLYIPFLCTRTDVPILYPNYRRAIEHVGRYLDLI